MDARCTLRRSFDLAVLHACLVESNRAAAENSLSQARVPQQCGAAGAVAVEEQADTGEDQCGPQRCLRSVRRINEPAAEKLRQRLQKTGLREAQTIESKYKQR